MQDVSLEEFNKKYPLKTLTVAGKRWEYISKGSGKITLLVLPGGGQYAKSQYRMVDSFSDQYKVIIPTVYDIYSI